MLGIWGNVDGAALERDADWTMVTTECSGLSGTVLKVKREGNMGHLKFEIDPPMPTEHLAVVATIHEVVDDDGDNPMPEAIVTIRNANPSGFSAMITDVGGVTRWELASFSILALGL